MVQLCRAVWACRAVQSWLCAELAGPAMLQGEEKLQEVARGMWASSIFPQSTGLFSSPAIIGGLVRQWDICSSGLFLCYPATQQLDSTGPDTMMVAVGLS